MKIKKKWLKKIILMLILTLSLFVIPLFSSVKVSADVVEHNIIIEDTIWVDDYLLDFEFTKQIGTIEDEDFYEVYQPYMGQLSPFWRDINSILLINGYNTFEIELCFVFDNGIDVTYLFGLDFVNSTDLTYKVYFENDYINVLSDNNYMISISDMLKEDELDFNYFHLSYISMKLDNNYFYVNSEINEFTEAEINIYNQIMQACECWALVVDEIYYNENIGDPAYKNGFSIGYDKGYYEGYDEGKSIGYADGYIEGKELGRIEGYDMATEEFYQSRYDEGYSTGYDTGYDTGYSDGHNGSGFGIVTLMGSTLASFFGAFWTFASFEIFGIQLWVIPAIIGGVGLIWVVIKFFLGKGD